MKGYSKKDGDPLTTAAAFSAAQDELRLVVARVNRMIARISVSASYDTPQVTREELTEDRDAILRVSVLPCHVRPKCNTPSSLLSI